MSQICSCNNCDHHFICVYKKAFDDTILTIVKSQITETDKKTLSDKMYKVIGSYCKSYTYSVMTDSKEVIEMLHSYTSELEKEVIGTKVLINKSYHRCFKCKNLYEKRYNECPNCGSKEILNLK